MRAPALIALLAKAGPTRIVDLVNFFTPNRNDYLFQALHRHKPRDQEICNGHTDRVLLSSLILIQESSVSIIVRFCWSNYLGRLDRRLTTLRCISDPSLAKERRWLFTARYPCLNSILEDCRHEELKLSHPIIMPPPPPAVRTSASSMRS